MQIKFISLYGKNSERRDIEFKLGKVNIITGVSNRGKTSLIDIIEYCLGSSECNVKAGYIPATVDYYAILLQLSDCQVFIARAAPLKGMKSNSTAYMLIESKISIPKRSEFINRYDIKSVVEILSHKLIRPKPPQGFEVETTIDQSLHFLFQSQTEVANNELLFHHQAKTGAIKHIKGTLPYFIGVASDDYQLKKQKIATLIRTRNALERDKADILALRQNASITGHRILSEAINLGLTESKELLPSQDELIGELEKIASWVSLDSSFTDNSDNDEQTLGRLDKKLDQLRKEKSLILARISEVDNYSASELGYQQAIETQAYRLRSIGLFEKIEKSDVCPICDTNDIGESRIDKTINNALTELSSKLENIHRKKPNIDKFLKGLHEEKNQINQEQKYIRSSIKELRESSPRLSKIGKLEIEQALVVGKAQLFFQEYYSAGNVQGHLNQIDLLNESIEELATELDPKALDKRLNQKLNLIAEDMTKWSRELKLEHSSGHVRLDEKKLTVMIEKPNETLSLNNIGGGENWLGYHLVTYFALAKWFIEQSRPVGNFLFLDQPSQNYFPNSGTGDLSEIKTDKDRETLKAMFRWIFRVVESLDSNLQVIITDHADIDEQWFQEAVIDKKWRGENALIPKSWYEVDT